MDVDVVVVVVVVVIVSGRYIFRLPRVYKSLGTIIYLSSPQNIYNRVNLQYCAIVIDIKS